MSGFNIGSIRASLLLDTGRFKSEAREATNVTGRLKGELGGLQGLVAGLGGAFAGLQISRALYQAVDTAATLGESLNKFRVAFDSNADAAQAWADGFSRSMGVFRGEIYNAMGTFALMLDGMGMTSNAVMDMSRNLTALAADMSSLDNITFDEALTKLRAGLSGETEPLKSLGAVVSDANVQLYALREGIIANGETMNEQQKIVARYGVILEALKKRQGDLANTFGSLTNQQRRAEAGFKDLRTELGEALLPAATQFFTVVNNIIPSVRNWVENNREAATSVVTLGAGLTGALIGLSALSLALPGLTLGLNAVKLAALGAWGALTSPVTITLAVVVGAVAGLVAAWQTLRDEWDSNISGMKQTFGPFVDWFSEKVDAVRGLLSGLADKAREAFGQWQAAFADMFGDIPTEPAKQSGEGVGQAFVEGVQESSKTLAGNFADNIKSAMAGLSGLVDSLYQSSGIADMFKEAPAPVAFEYDSDISKLVGELPADAGAAAKELATLKDRAADLVLSLDPAAAAFAEITEDIEALSAAGMLTSEVLSQLGGRAFDGLKDDEAALTRFVEQMRTLGDMGNDVLVGMGNAANTERLNQQLEDQARAVESFRERFTDDPLFEEFDRDLAILAELGLQNTEVAYRLGEAYGQAFTQAGISLRGVLTDIPGVTAEVAAGIQSIGIEAQNAARAAKFDGIKSALQGIDGAASNLAGSMQNGVARAFDIVARSVRLAGTGVQIFEAISKVAATGVRLSWESALGIFGLILEAVYQLAGAFGFLGDEAPKELRGIAKVMDEVKQMSEQWIDRLTEDVLKFVRTGELSFKEFANSVIDDLFRIAFSELVLSPIVNGLGKIAGFANGGAFSGGQVIPYASGGVVSQPTAFPMRGGKTGLMGEAGPEAIMPLTRMSSGRLGVESKGSAPVVNVNIQAADIPKESISVQQSQGLDGSIQLDVIIEGAMRRVLGSGRMNRDLDALFGLQRRPA